MHELVMEKPSLVSEARKLILEYLNSHRGSRPSRESLTRLMLSRHHLPDSEFDDFFWYEHCAHEACGQAIGRVIREADLKMPKSEDEQPFIPTLEGYKKAQEWYSIKDGETQRVVHAYDLTNDEIEQKIHELERMQDGLAEHIRELYRLIEDPRRRRTLID